MRTIVLSAILLILVTAQSKAQNRRLQDDFEGNGLVSTWFGDNCNVNTSYSNPYQQGENNSLTVMRYNDVGGQYANVRFDINENYDLSSNHTFSLKIYVPSSGLTGTQPNQVSLKLQDGTLSEPWITQCEIIKPIELDQWQSISFDFLNDEYVNLDPSSLPPTERTDFNRVVIQVNGENNYDLVLAYIDDFDYDGTISVDPVYNMLVWSDEFETNGAVDSAKWHHETQLPTPAGWHNGELQHYTNRTDNSYVSNGILNIVGKKETYIDQGVTKEYTSARLNSKFAFQYGKVEVRAKLPTGAGTWPAIWALGKNLRADGSWWDMQGYGTTIWPECGEIDIMEHWGSNQNYVSSATHTPSSYGATVNNGGQTISDVSTEFHTYTLRWYPEKLVFSVDGVTHYIYQPDEINNDTWPFNAEQFLLLNFAFAPETDPDFVEDTFEIDYVRVYQSQDAKPTDITIGNNTFNENCPIHTVVGDFSTATMGEKDIYDYTYSLIAGDGTNDADNNKFIISGNELQTNAEIDYEEQNTFNIYVRTDDGNGGDYEKAFVLSAKNLNDNLPVLTDEIFLIDKNSSNKMLVGTVSGTDADGDITPLNYSIIAGNSNDVFAIDSITGEIIVNKATELDFDTTSKYTLTVEVSDGTYIDSAVISILLSDLNETGIDDLQLSNINVYPNPTEGMVTIEFSNITYTLMHIRVINTTGQLVYVERFENTESTKTIDLSSYPMGSYIMLIKSKDSVTAKKISLE